MNWGKFLNLSKEDFDELINAKEWSLKQSKFWLLLILHLIKIMWKNSRYLFSKKISRMFPVFLCDSYDLLLFSKIIKEYQEK